MSIIEKPAKKEIPIHINCFPENSEKENILAWSKSYVDAYIVIAPATTNIKYMTSVIQSTDLNIDVES